MKLPPKARLAMQTIVGVALGAAFDSSLWQKFATSPVTVTALLVFTTLATWSSIQFLRRSAGYSPVTSFFAAVPGGCAPSPREPTHQRHPVPTADEAAGRHVRWGPG